MTNEPKELRDLLALAESAEKQQRLAMAQVCYRAVALIRKLQRAKDRRITALIAFGEPNRAAALARELGRMGGSKGGLKRAAMLTPERRREIARLAAQRRWHPDEGTKQCEKG